MDIEGLNVVDEMKIGMMFGANDRQSALDRARKMESSGLDSIWVGDHIAFHIPVIESLSLLSFCAAATERIELATGVLLLPLRNPTLTAADARQAVEATRAAGVTLGETYAEPLVDHGEARARALAAYEAIRAR